MKTNKNKFHCPCGKDKEYINCCGIIHQDITKVKTAEDLMRSRYTAFTMGNIQYLKLSHLKKTAEYKDEIELKDWCQSVNWIKLEILSTFLGSENDDNGKVHFKAYYIENGKEYCIEEKSTFVKENNHWVYKAFE